MSNREEIVKKLAEIGKQKEELEVELNTCINGEFEELKTKLTKIIEKLNGVIEKLNEIKNSFDRKVPGIGKVYDEIYERKLMELRNLHFMEIKYNGGEIFTKVPELFLAIYYKNDKLVEYVISKNENLNEQFEYKVKYYTNRIYCANNSCRNLSYSKYVEELLIGARLIPEKN